MKIKANCNLWGPFCNFWGLFCIFLGGKPWEIFVFFGEGFVFFGGIFVFSGEKKSGGIFVFFGGIFVFSGLVFNMIHKKSGQKESKM
jgi:hypothetical protein